jgi:Fe-Mn family superoxide dismutase
VRCELPPLPYAVDALAPHVGPETLMLHHGTHHRAALDRLGSLLSGTRAAERSLEDLVRTSDGAVFHHAAEAWNHAFLWRSMTPRGGDCPRASAFARLVGQELGSWGALREQVRRRASAHLGAGWLWLYLESGTGRLRFETTKDAETPFAHGHHPLLGVDLWEHAYYLDHRGDRAAWVEIFFDRLVDWAEVDERLRKAW